MSNEKGVHHYLDLIVKGFDKNSEINQVEGFWMPIKDIQEWGLLRSKLGVRSKGEEEVRVRNLE